MMNAVCNQPVVMPPLPCLLYVELIAAAFLYDCLISVAVLLWRDLEWELSYIVNHMLIIFFVGLARNIKSEFPVVQMGF